MSCFYLWKYILLCFFMQHILQLCTQLCSCQTMFCILHLICALPCYCCIYFYLLMLTHFCVKFLSHVILFELRFIWTIALLENALPWTSSQSVLHVCVVVYPSQLPYCGFIQCCVAIGCVGQHLATYFAEWKYTNQTVNGSLWSAKPFSFFLLPPTLVLHWSGLSRFCVVWCYCCWMWK